MAPWEADLYRQFHRSNDPFLDCTWQEYLDCHAPQRHYSRTVSKGTTTFTMSCVPHDYHGSGKHQLARMWTIEYMIREDGHITRTDTYAYAKERLHLAWSIAYGMTTHLEQYGRIKTR